MPCRAWALSGSSRSPNASRSVAPASWPRSLLSMIRGIVCPTPTPLSDSAAGQRGVQAQHQLRDGAVGVRGSSATAVKPAVTSSRAPAPLAGSP